MKKLLISYAITTAVIFIITLATSIFTKGMENNSKIAIAAGMVVVVSMVVVMVVGKRVITGVGATLITATAVIAGIIQGMISGMITGVILAVIAGVILATEKNIKKVMVITCTIATVFINSAIIYYGPRIISHII